MFLNQSQVKTIPPRRKDPKVNYFLIEVFQKTNSVKTTKPLKYVIIEDTSASKEQQIIKTRGSIH